MGVDRKPWLDWYRKGRPVPTDAECVESCIANAEEAARSERRSREWYGKTDPGSEDCDKAWEAICRDVSDQRHWRAMADWYRHRVAAAEREAVRVAAAAQREAARLAALGPPPARERQVGEDDDDDQPVSAWADIGAAVAG